VPTEKGGKKKGERGKSRDLAVDVLRLAAITGKPEEKEKSAKEKKRRAGFRHSARMSEGCEMGRKGEERGG